MNIESVNKVNKVNKVKRIVIIYSKLKKIKIHPSCFISCKGVHYSIHTNIVEAIQAAKSKKT